jgi:hypothetical protein
MGALDFYMEFREKYTTQELIDADETGLEARKILIATGTYALLEVLEDLIKQLEKLNIR